MPEMATTSEASLDAILAGRPGLTPAEIADLVARDQESVWRQGQRVLVEAYIARHPALGDSTIQMDLVYAEVLLRESLGERPSADEYCQRFPHLGNAVSSLFMLHKAMIGNAEPAPTPRLSFRIAQPAANPAANGATKPDIELPGFDVLEEIGSGGMGIVYRARQIALDRIVAIKMLHNDGRDTEWETRLQREAEAVAQVQHPNIVQVYEVGLQEGHPFLVLEYVPGGTLAQRLKSGFMSPADSADLIRTVAGAMHVAHQHQIIHRDLKPGNILLAMGDGQQPISKSILPKRNDAIDPRLPLVPKVTDFGLAKRLDHSGISHSGVMLGTPSYMAPEQASGSQQISPAADIYSLGAVLYECLTGRPPFQGESPLSVLMQVANAEPVQPARLRTGIPRDLESVCLKCLEKSPAKRYASAQHLADDLQRFQHGEPTLARPLSAFGKVVKLIRRHPLPTALIALFVVTLFTGLLGVTWQWREAVHARSDESIQRQQAEQNLYHARLAQAGLLWENGDTGRARGLLAECLPEQGRDDLRGWEWHYLNRAFRTEAAAIPMDHWVNGLAIMPRGGDESERMWMAIGRPRFTPFQQSTSEDGRAILMSWIEPHLGVRATQRNGPELPGGAMCVAIQPQPTTGNALVAWGTNSGHIVFADSLTGQHIRTVATEGPTTHIVFHPDGSRLYAAISREPWRLIELNVATGECLSIRPFPTGLPGALAIHPNGRWLACGGSSPQLRIFQLPGWQFASDLPGNQEGITSATWSADGRILAAGTASGVVATWEADSFTESRRWQAHSGPIYALAFAPNGQTLTTGSADKAIRTWDNATGLIKRTFRGHTATVRCLAYSPDGSRLFSGGQDSTLRLWDTSRDPRGRRLTFNSRLNDIALETTPAGPVARAVALQGLSRSWSMAEGRELSQANIQSCSRRSYPVRYNAFIDGGRKLIAIPKANPKTVAAWDADSGQLLQTWPAAFAAVTTIAADPNGRWLTWAAGLDGASDIHWWDETAHQPGGPIRLNVSSVRALAISPNGHWIAAISNVPNPTDDCSIWIIDTTGRQTPREIARGRAACGALTFRPDSGEFAIVVNATVRAFRTADWQASYQFPCESSTTFLAYSPDGRRLATVGYESNVTLADTASGKRVFQLRGLAPGRPEDMAADARVAFSDDGHWLVSTNWDGSLNIFDGTPIDAAGR